MNNSLFYSEVKKSLFKGRLTTEQVKGMDALFAVWKSRGTKDRRHLAYLLATTYHETGTRMIPVREGQGQRKLWSDKQARNAVAKLFREKKISRDYALPGSFGNSFYGRGLAQITFEENYKRLGGILGIDLVRYPDKALENEVAAMILVEGSLKGLSLKGDFTKYALEDFIYGEKCDYVRARQVINRMDRASDVANYAVKFEAALEAAGTEHVPFKLKKAAGRVAAPVATSAVVSSKEELRGIQTKLKELGYHEVGDPDGRWGDKTQTAVLAFRAENDLELLPTIDDKFKAALWTATPRRVGEKRATAKLTDLKGIAPGATEMALLKKVAGFFGVGSFFVSGTLSTDDVTGVTAKINAVKELMAILPSPLTIFALGVGAFGLYWLATRVGGKIVSAYREGRVL